ncbi:MAG: Ig domain-containing protein [Selenomonadaceae bacterium]|nr:Ig domain-containing protein [Selenomonadaceae bacterium]
MTRKIFAALLMTVMIFFSQNVSAYSNINYRAYVEGNGWMKPVGEGEVAGTVMQARRMEALVINFNGGIKYSAHVENIGWQDWVYEGNVAGTVGHNLRMEAIRIQLTGRSEQYFDVYYRAHVENGGWLGWAKNGEPAGTAGASLRMEAIQIRLVEKGTQVNRGNKPAFYQYFPNAPTA